MDVYTDNMRENNDLSFDHRVTKELLITLFILQVYEGMYAMSIRDFAKAANLFLETISTFTSYELMDYVQFVTYTVYVSIIALDRSTLLEKVPVQARDI